MDGTLVDINPAEYGKETDKLIRLIKERNIPLILTSAKTRLEQNKIREDLGPSDPFIVENGGAIVIAQGYFPDYTLKDIKYPVRETREIKNEASEVNHEIIVEPGKPADYIRARLSDIRKKYGINFRRVADISVEKLSNLALISRDQAKRMAQRNYGETILQIQSEDH
ncbi:MAG TPA: HAD hydrolase family protein [Nitrososphaeraceae archaeon]|nr:HAD hydrolase family protein [Nitrososphaeraceae archaeon]